VSHPDGSTLHQDKEPKPKVEVGEKEQEQVGVQRKSSVGTITHLEFHGHGDPQGNHVGVPKDSVGQGHGQRK
jgi:hypothetical protein